MWYLPTRFGGPPLARSLITPTWSGVSSPRETSVVARSDFSMPPDSVIWSRTSASWFSVIRPISTALRPMWASRGWAGVGAVPMELHQLTLSTAPRPRKASASPGAGWYSGPHGAPGFSADGIRAAPGRPPGGRERAPGGGRPRGQRGALGGHRGRRAAARHSPGLRAGRLDPRADRGAPDRPDHPRPLRQPDPGARRGGAPLRPRPRPDGGPLGGAGARRPRVRE